jgi:membrane-associated phospholipid phosphatase
LAGRAGFVSRVLEADARASAHLRVAERPGRTRRTAILLSHSGDSWYWGLALAAIWLLGGTYWKERAVALFISIGVVAVIVQAIKWLVRRRRPAGEWGAIYRRTDPHSFPSGHAARMAMLTVLCIALGPAWLAVLLILWAPLVAVARVAMGVHYLSDVVAGSLLGLVIGLVLVPAVPLAAAFSGLLARWIGV